MFVSIEAYAEADAGGGDVGAHHPMCEMHHPSPTSQSKNSNFFGKLLALFCAIFPKLTNDNVENLAQLTCYWRLLKSWLFNAKGGCEARRSTHDSVFYHPNRNANQLTKIAT